MVGAMQYRVMQPDDHARLVALWRDCDGLGLRDSDSPAGIAKYLARNPGLSFVAERGGRILGTIMAGHDGRRGYILHLAVAAGERRRGVASRLVERCLAALSGVGIDKTHVHVIGDNRAGRDFWLARGFHHRGEIEMYSFVNGDNPDV